MVPVVGNWFNAQQLFNANDFACSAGQSIGEYCSAAQDTCCAVCPNAPITGPGTLIVMALGTFANLIFVLWYQSEAPYNLAYQIVATDGAAFGLMNRLVQDDFRLSEFHYYFIPLAIMSCMPLALAACLCDIPSLHSMNPSAQEVLKHTTYLRQKAEEQNRLGNTENESAQPLLTSTSHSLRGSFGRRRTSETLRGSGNDAAVPSERDPSVIHPVHSNGRPASAIRVLADVKLSRGYLIITAWCFFTVHLIGWPFLFGYTYFINDTFNQPMCGESFDLRWTRNVLASLVGSWLFFALLLWILFTRVLFFGAQKRDMIETVGAALHFVSRPKADRTLPPNHWFDPTPEKKPKIAFLKSGHARGRSILRSALSLGCFALWLAEYMGIYFVAVRDFVLIGMNGFDFGQIVAVIGIIIPISLIARAKFDYDDAWQTKTSLWAKETKHGRKQHVEEDVVDPKHPALSPDWKHGDPVPIPSTHPDFVTVKYHSEQPSDKRKAPRLVLPEAFVKKMSKEDDGAWSDEVEEAYEEQRSTSSNRGGTQRSASQRSGSQRNRSQRSRHLSIHSREGR